MKLIPHKVNMLTAVNARDESVLAKEMQIKVQAAKCGPKRGERKPNMEVTLTPSGAPFSTQHKIAERRRAFFRKSTSAARNRAADLVKSGNLASVPAAHSDNGR